MQDTHQLFIATITSWVLTCAPAAAVTLVSTWHSHCHFLPCFLMCNQASHVSFSGHVVLQHSLQPHLLSELVFL